MLAWFLGSPFGKEFRMAQHHSKLQCKIYQHVLRHHPSAEGRPITLVLRPWWRGKKHIQGSSKTKYLKQEGQVRDASNKNMNQVAGVREVQVPQRRQEFS